MQRKSYDLITSMNKTYKTNRHNYPLLHFDPWVFYSLIGCVCTFSLFSYFCWFDRYMEYPKVMLMPPLLVGPACVSTLSLSTFMSTFTLVETSCFFSSVIFLLTYHTCYCKHFIHFCKRTLRFTAGHVRLLLYGCKFPNTNQLHRRVWVAVHSRCSQHLRKGENFEWPQGEGVSF